MDEKETPPELAGLELPRAPEVPFESLVGKTVDQVVGCEWALWDGPDGAPVFHDPRVPCLQVEPLYLRFDTGDWLCVVTGTYNDSYLRAFPSHGPDTHPRNESDPRIRNLDEVDSGRIEAVETSLGPDGLVARARLTFPTSDILVVTGVVFDDDHGGVRFIEHWDSLLVFTNPADAVNALKKKRRHTQKLRNRARAFLRRAALRRQNRT